MERHRERERGVRGLSFLWRGYRGFLLVLENPKSLFFPVLHEKKMRSRIASHFWFISLNVSHCVSDLTHFFGFCIYSESFNFFVSTFGKFILFFIFTHFAFASSL
ncbi:hypothetical protein I3760_07G224900 [Carya illinoinensis]|nr:hypothetical protein I3760_07G224900 [Carya illinoinensis]